MHCLCKYPYIFLEDNASKYPNKLPFAKAFIIIFFSMIPILCSINEKIIIIIKIITPLKLINDFLNISRRVLFGHRVILQIEKVEIAKTIKLNIKGM